MALIYFTVTGNYLSVAGQELWDGSAQPALRPVSGSIIFTPLFQSGDALKTDQGVLVLQPVQATITYGVIRRGGNVGVKLLAKTPDLGIESDLYYRVSFFDLRASDGSQISLNTFDFQAPESDDTLDIADLTPEPGTPVLGRPVPGPTGPAGPAGPAGPPGPPGSVWWSGEGPPTVVIGASPGDFYIDTLSGTLYQL